MESSRLLLLFNHHVDPLCLFMKSCIFNQVLCTVCIGLAFESFPFLFVFNADSKKKKEKVVLSIQLFCEERLAKDFLNCSSI